MDQNKEKLFKDFPPVSTQEWKEKIIKDLKGADYDKKLIWKTNEGFMLQPFYRSEDLEDIKYLDKLPGNFPFVRGNKINSNDWYIRQDISITDLEKANKKALDILMQGVNSLGFLLDTEKDYTRDDIDILLKNVFAEIVEINFITSPKQAVDIMMIFYDLVKQYNRDFQKIHGSVDFDPLGFLTLKGKFYSSKEKSFDICKELIEIGHHLPNFTVLSVYGSDFRNAGASIVEELGYSLAMGAEFLTQLTEKSISVDRIAPNIKFNFGIGGNYFMEIAKLRAARLLWSHIVKAYGPSDEKLVKMNIHGITTDWNKSMYDPYVNMLRTTTEAMSAGIAGVDSLTIKSFNSAYEEPTEFSERIARNQQLLLKEESYFDKVVDPAAGSYYIENLTDSIAKEAWDLFLEIESKGGYIEAFKQGFIQDKFKETKAKRENDIATRKINILGTNQYPNPGEHINKEISESILKSNDGTVANAEAQAIETYRAAQEFERLRYTTDKFSLSNERPKVFMLTYGNIAMRIAKAQFTGNFFACAGFEIINNIGFKTAADGIEAALEQNADIVVICSSDEEYPEIATEISEKLNQKAIVIIAGYPKESIEALQKAGIKHFIHVRSNVLETLQEFQKELGIN
ncbi:methylmalonyl-CoA mutase family protein [Bacteroidota bacterium]